MKSGTGRRQMFAGLLLLAGIASPACVRSTGHPPDPTPAPAVREDKVVRKEEKKEEKKEKEEPLVPKIISNEVAADARKILEKLAEAEGTIAKLMERELSSEQTEQVGVARSFLDQAKAALAEEDLQRAAVLADKGAVLARDVEEASRK